MKTIVSLSILSLLVVGCASNISSPTPDNLSETLDIKLYEDGDLGELNYTVIDEIEAIDCSPTWFRTASSDNALNELASVAQENGANGILDLSCWDSGLGPKLFCNNSATCSGKAILVE